MTGGTLKTTKKCFICGKDFKEGDKKVRGPLSFLQVSIGVVPTMTVIYSFSMRYYKIPVFLHSIKNYDSHCPSSPVLQFFFWGLYGTQIIWA